MPEGRAAHTLGVEAIRFFHGQGAGARGGERASPAHREQAPGLVHDVLEVRAFDDRKFLAHILMPA